MSAENPHATGSRGAGWPLVEDPEDCPACDGQGYISAHAKDGTWQPYTCPDCGGAGVVEADD